MSETDWGELARLVRAQALDEAIAHLEEGLQATPSSRFATLLGTAFSNDAADVAAHIDGFLVECERTFEVRAIYLEMNGFDINPDRWFFDYFAFDRYVQDEDNLEWLCEFNITSWPQTTLFGMESVQRDFDWYSNHRGHEDPNAKAAASYAIPLVMCRFAKLISSAVAVARRPFRVPILATAHDFDVVARFLPPSA